MITKRVWIQTVPRSGREWLREGWYLFGILPLYVRDLTARERQ